MSRWLSISLAMVGAGVAMLVAAGFAEPATVSATADAPKGGTLRIMSPDELDHVDPALAYLTDAWMVEYATCAKLFNHPDESGAAGLRVVPEVVRSYTVSPNGRTYTFELEKTYRFHTGARVTAQSFADAINRLAQPKLGSPATNYLREIVGAANVIDGKAQSVSGVRVLGRYRLQVRLSKPVGDFVTRLAMPFFCPILPDTPVDPAGIDNPPGSGPYYVAERVDNHRTVLERNPFYRGDRPANVDRIVWTPGVTLDACLQAVEDDRADFCGGAGAPPTAYRALGERYAVNEAGGRLFVKQTPAIWFLAFNHNRPAFRGAGQIPLKKAINYAIDRPAMARAFGYLAGKRTDQMLPPGLARPTGIYPLGGANPAAAQDWYAKARLKPRTLVVYAWALPSVVTVAQVLAFNLKQLGIDVELKYFEPRTAVTKALNPDEPFDIAISAWGADYWDGAAFFIPLLAPGGSANAVHGDDPDIRRRIAAADRLTGEARRQAWADLDVDLMRDDPPWAPFMHSNDRTLVSRSLGCFVQHPLYRVDIVAVCKKR